MKKSRSARRTHLEVRFNRSFPISGPRKGHGIHSADVSDIARAMNLSTFEEYANNHEKSVVVYGTSEIIGRFAEFFFSLVVDEAIPDRLGQHNMPQMEGGKYLVTLTTLGPL